MASQMKFSTFHLFSLPDWMNDREVVHNELEQGRWLEELGFEEAWLAEHTRAYRVLQSAHSSRWSRARSGFFMRPRSRSASSTPAK